MKRQSLSGTVVGSLGLPAECLPAIDREWLCTGVRAIRIWLVVACFFFFDGGSVARAQAPVVAEPDAASSSAASAPTPARSRAPLMVRQPIPLPSTPAQIAIPDLRAPTVTSPPSPTFLPNCDASGCWGSDGIRYNAIGGALMRSDGRMCQNFNGVLQCP